MWVSGIPNSAAIPEAAVIPAKTMSIKIKLFGSLSIQVMSLFSCIKDHHINILLLFSSLHEYICPINQCTLPLYKSMTLFPSLFCQAFIWKPFYHTFQVIHNEVKFFEFSRCRKKFDSKLRISMLCFIKTTHSRF